MISSSLAGLKAFKLATIVCDLAADDDFLMSTLLFGRTGLAKQSRADVEPRSCPIFLAARVAPLHGHVTRKTYRDVVHACLTGSWAEGFEDDDAMLAHAYFTMTVGSLEV